MRRLKKASARVIGKIKGFTLTELLIVIAILGIIAAAVLIAINPIKRMGQSRDSIRKSNLAQISEALEEYYVMNGRYPDSVPGGEGCWGWEAGSVLNGEDDPFLEILKNQGYLKTVPIETTPLLDRSYGSMGWSRCSYRYTRAVNPCGGTGNTYAVLYAWLETDSGKDDTRPDYFGNDSSCWGEAAPGVPDIDDRDWAIFMKE